MVATIPPNVGFGYIIGGPFTKFSPDGGDAGDDPDPEYLSGSGTIQLLLSAVNPYLVDYAAHTFIYVDKIPVTFGPSTNGLLTGPNGSTQIKVVATNDADLNPTDRYYQVDLQPFGYPPLRLFMQVPEGTTRDIVQDAQVGVNGGSPVVRGPSNYEEAVRLGLFTGTEAEYLASLGGSGSGSGVSSFTGDQDANSVTYKINNTLAVTTQAATTMAAGPMSTAQVVTLAGAAPKANPTFTTKITTPVVKATGGTPVVGATLAFTNADGTMGVGVIPQTKSAAGDAIVPLTPAANRLAVYRSPTTAVLIPTGTTGEAVIAAGTPAAARLASDSSQTPLRDTFANISAAFAANPTSKRPYIATDRDGGTPYDSNGTLLQQSGGGVNSVGGHIVPLASIDTNVPITSATFTNVPGMNWTLGTEWAGYAQPVIFNLWAVVAFGCTGAVAAGHMVGAGFQIVNNAGLQLFGPPMFAIPAIGVTEQPVYAPFNIQFPVMPGDSVNLNDTWRLRVAARTAPVTGVTITLAAGPILAPAASQAPNTTGPVAYVPGPARMWMTTG